MGNNISFVAGAVLLVVSIMVMIEYWPRNIRPIKNLPPPTMLQIGIFFGFCLTASNTLWWQVLNIAVVSAGIMTAGEFQYIGKYMDAPLKGGMAIVGIIHLLAKRKMKAEAKIAEMETRQ